MAYNPQHGALSAKPFSPSQAVPTDGRSYYYDEALYGWRPYQSLSEVLTYLSTAKSRTGQFPVFVHSGTLESDGTFTGGSISEYWFKDGTEDADLVLRTTPATPSVPNLQQVLSAGATLSQDNTVEMGAHDLIFSTDASNYNKLLPASFEIRRGRGSMLAQDDWAVAQLQTTDQVHTARFQVYPVSASSFTSEIRAWDQTVNNWKNVAVAANAQTGIKLEVNPSWQTSNDAIDYRSLRVVSGDGTGQAAIEIDPELLPDATGGEVALSWDETTGQVRKGGTPGGGSTYTPTITTASTSQTLSTDYETWVFTGSSAATFTLPAISGNTAKKLTIINKGTEELTLSGTMWNGENITTLYVLPGDIVSLQNDGTDWLKTN